MPTSALADHFDGTRSNLESTAGREYRTRCRDELVAVDMPTPEGEFFFSLDHVRRSVRSRSVDYCRLVNWDEQYIKSYGFDYLNDAHCSAITADIHEALLAALAEIGDARLFASHELFTRTNEWRDETMLANISNYCASSAFHSGVFLVGAAHRKSLFLKTAASASQESTPVQWDFVGSV